jgi:hypothetical protein
MQRHCTNCDRAFTAKDLAREVSKGMEAERKALGLEGVLFRYYLCPACGHADIFADVATVAGERPENFSRRQRELEAALKELHDEEVDVVICRKQPRSIP